MLQATNARALTGSPELAMIGMIALSQTMVTIASSTKGSAWLLFLLLMPLFAIVKQHLASDSRGGAAEASGTQYTGQHPVEVLFAQGKTHAQALETRQSKTLAAAVTEYKRRYRRNPPPGFDAWFQMAQDSGLLLVDEFDTVMQSIEPFWGEDPQVLRMRIQSAMATSPASAPDHLIEFNILDHSISWANPNPSDKFPSQIATWFGTDALAILPNLTIAINPLDEPRVVIRHDVLENAMQKRFPARKPFRSLSTFSESRAAPADPSVSFLNIREQQNWSTLTLSCPCDSAAVASASESDAFFTFPTELEFVHNVTAAMDVCSHPSFRNMHGLFIAPETMRLTHSLVPIFSQAKASSFNDILYPSPFYGLEMDRQAPKPTADVEWDQKLSQLYWAGSSTGGHATSETWQIMQRQRWVLHADREYMAEKDVILLQESVPAGHWIPYKSSFTSPFPPETISEDGLPPNSTNAAPIADLFSLTISLIPQCTGEACEAERKAFHLSGVVPLPGPDDSLKSKYVLDIDGNSFSGRYYRLLSSKSAVLKQTILKEWHDDWLVPWYHYIPVSLEGKEVYELMRFLVRDERGDKIGREIGEKGRRWVERVLRKRDLELVMLRILMEYGRIMSDDRDAMNFEL